MIINKFFDKVGKAPFHFVHFVTAKCNARCSHCFYYKNLNKKRNELTLEEIEKLCKSMGNVYYLGLTGGEPFLRKDLPEIAHTYYKYNNVKNLFIPTNGSIPNKIFNQSKKILELCPKLSFSINISLDGLEKDHDKIRGMKGSFSKAVQTYNELKDIKRINTSFVVTVSTLNQYKLTELKDFVENELKANIVFILVRGVPKNPRIKDINIDIYKKNYESVIIKNKFSPLNYDFIKKKIRDKMNKMRYKLIIDTYKKNKFITPCYAGSLDIVMYEEGDIYPCELLDMKMGNIRDYNYNFQQLWHSEKAKKIRRYIKKSKCFCTHECNLMENILFNPKNLIKMIFK